MKLKIMETNDKLKEINVKNRTWYHFDDITKFQDFDNDNISIDEKPYKNILVYNISCKIWFVENLFELGLSNRWIY